MILLDGRECAQRKTRRLLQSLLKGPLCLDLLSNALDVLEEVENAFLLLKDLLLLFLLLEESPEDSHEGARLCLDHPLLHLLGLADPFVSLLRRDLFPVLQDVSLDQVPVLELLLLELLFLAAMFHLHALLLVLHRFDLGERNSNFVLLCQYVKQVTLLLLHLELEFADFLLLILHLLAKLFEGV